MVSHPVGIGRHLKASGHAGWDAAPSVVPQHPFAEWLVRNHGNDESPRGDLAREFAGLLPPDGDRERLAEAVREAERRDYAESWALYEFTRAWNAWRLGRGVR